MNILYDKFAENQELFSITYVGIFIHFFFRALTELGDSDTELITEITYPLI